MSPTTADLNNIAAGIFGAGVTFSGLSAYFQTLLLFTWETLLYANVNPATATPAQSNAAWVYTLPLVFSVQGSNGQTVDEILNIPQWIAGAPAAIPGGSVPPVTPQIVSTPPPAPGTPTTPAAPTTPTPTTPTKTPTPAAVPPKAPTSNDYFDAGSYCDYFPDDPICNLDLYNGFPPTVVFVGSPGSGTLGPINVTVEGPNGADVTKAVDGALGDLWDATVGAVDAAVADAVNAIQQVLTEIGNALKAAWNILSHLAGMILAFLQQLLSDVISGILRVLQEIKNLAQDLYKKVLLPIAQGVINLRDALIDVYQRFIRPMLIVLQDLRKVLSILAAFHVGFAQKLDAKLADLEARITRPFLYVLSFVNGVANWINLIITAGYLLQKSVFLNSLAAYVGEALNLQLNAMNQPPSAAAVGAANAANQTVPAAQASADLANFVGHDAGPLPTGMQPYVDQFTGYLAQGPY